MENHTSGVPLAFGLSSLGILSAAIASGPLAIALWVIGGLLLIAAIATWQPVRSRVPYFRRRDLASREPVTRAASEAERFLTKERLETLAVADELKREGEDLRRLLTNATPNQDLTGDDRPKVVAWFRRCWDFLPETYRPLLGDREEALSLAARRGDLDRFIVGKLSRINLMIQDLGMNVSGHAPNEPEKSGDNNLDQSEQPLNDRDIRLTALLVSELPTDGQAVRWLCDQDFGTKFERVGFDLMIAVITRVKLPESRFYDDNLDSAQQRLIDSWDEFMLLLRPNVFVANELGDDRLGTLYALSWQDLQNAGIDEADRSYEVASELNRLSSAVCKAHRRFIEVAHGIGALK